jgi:hypothetical protein
VPISTVKTLPQEHPVRLSGMVLRQRVYGGDTPSRLGVNSDEGSRTSDEAEADAHAAAGADAEGGSQLAERIRPRHREAPQGGPPPAARHPSPVPTSPLRPPAQCAPTLRNGKQREEEEEDNPRALETSEETPPESHPVPARTGLPGPRHGTNGGKGETTGREGPVMAA